MYNKTRIQELAEMYVQSNDEDIFRELFDELHWMIDTQLRKNYGSLHAHWMDMEAEVIKKIWTNRKTLKNTSTRFYNRHYWGRISTHLFRAAGKIKKVREDYEYRSKISIDNVEKPKVDGFVDEEPIAEVAEIEEYEIEDKKKVRSTLKEKLSLKNKKYHKGIDKATIKREESYPILDICQRCKLPCKSHAAEGLKFQCFSFVGQDGNEKEMRGVEVQVGSEESEHGEKNPRTHIRVTQTKIGKPWEKDRK